MDEQKQLSEGFKKFLTNKDVDLCNRVLPITVVEVDTGEWAVGSLATEGVHYSTEDANQLLVYWQDFLQTR